MAGADLSGTTVMVTGAGRGLGRAMSEGLARAGANIVLFELDRPELDEAASAIAAATDPGRVLALTGDVTSEAEAATAVAAVVERFGKLDMLVNNAGLSPQLHHPSNLGERPSVWQIDPDHWRRVVAVNGVGPFIMTRAALPGMVERGWGRIVMVTTSLDTMTRGKIGPYGPAKACAEALAAMVSEEVAGTGVSANVLVPGGPANTRMIPEDGRFVDRGLLIQPEVMVAPVVWLASRASDGVNGRRFLGALFDPSLPPAEAAEKAGAPIAWTGLGKQSIRR